MFIEISPYLVFGIKENKCLSVFFKKKATSNPCCEEILKCIYYNRIYDVFNLYLQCL